MNPVSPDLLLAIDRYIEDLFAPSDATLENNLKAAEAAGLPTINVSAAEGKLLYLLAKISGARRILEIGTLGGYSTTWLARALPEGGVVVSLELEARHAQVAEKNLVRAGVGSRVSILVGPADLSLRRLIEAQEPAFDMVFIDADKPGYSVYLDLAMRISRPGTVIVADNVIRDGAVMDPSPADENARAARAFNAKVASHPRLESIILPSYKGKID